MSKKDRPLLVVDGYKKQAERLREYLANAGVDLKQTNALEAVAQMHGYPNFNTLKASAKIRAHEELWCTLSWGRAELPVINVTIDPELAYASFLQTVLINVSLMPDRPYSLAALEDDAALRGIYLFDEQSLIAALVTPGGLTEDEREPIPRGLFDPESPRRAAAWLAKAIEHRKDPGAEERRARFHHSQVAVNFSRDLDDIIRSEHGVEPASEDGMPLWELMQNVRIWGTATARVQGGCSSPGEPSEGVQRKEAAGDIESILKAVCPEGSRLALVYEPRKGWTVTDQFLDLPARHGKHISIFEVCCPSNWQGKTADEAIERFREIRRLRAGEMHRNRPL